MADQAPGGSEKRASGSSRNPSGRVNSRRAEPFLWLLPQGIRRVVETEGRGCLVLWALPIAIAAATFVVVCGVRLLGT